MKVERTSDNSITVSFGSVSEASRFQREQEAKAIGDNWTVAQLKKDLEHAQNSALELRQQLRLMEQHVKDEVWRWQADGTDHLKSMGNRMAVLIHACDLRKLLEEKSCSKPLILGIRGAAFDPPDQHRAFTYEEQPGNVVAIRIGYALGNAASKRSGDLIDHGLSLLKCLQEQGFGVFETAALNEHKQKDHGGDLNEDGRV